jgi:hypothetical protein
MNDNFKLKTKLKQGKPDLSLGSWKDGHLTISLKANNHILQYALDEFIDVLSTYED